jgi:hypothetical protein
MGCVPGRDQLWLMFHNCPRFDQALVLGWELDDRMRRQLFYEDEYATEDEVDEDEYATEDEVDEDEEAAEDEDEEAAEDVDENI